MSVFEYTFGLIAIILGLAMTDIASSVHRLVMNRQRVRWHPLPLMAASMALWLIVLQWWTAWYQRTNKAISFSSLVVSIAQALLLYLISAASLPDDVGQQAEGDDPVDLARYYDRVRPYLLSLFAITVLWLGVIPSWTEFLAGHPRWFSVIANTTISSAFLACAFIRARWFNMLVLGAVLAALTYRWGADALTA